MASATANVIFSADVRNMDVWAKRTGIPLTTAEALGTTYARAHRWLLRLKTELVESHGWKNSTPSDSRMLFCVERPSRTHNNLPVGPNQRLQLPQQASSFFSPDRRVQWQMVFHSDIFATQRKLCPPLDSMLNLIQCLLTGLVVLSFDEPTDGGVYRTSRGLPKIEWVQAHQAELNEVFGRAHYNQLYRACSDTKYSYKLDLIPTSQLR
ncbi:hypothetical protein PLICRDRAFT_41704 [Plicaturopsis crispa FD-325 SS-3]|nr:hypothetical protein PLICRDRAFT_41704 [Plicaturopsis crispa FD-325 SS-3]